MISTKHWKQDELSDVSKSEIFNEKSLKMEIYMNRDWGA